MPKYKVLEPLNHNNALYPPGVLVDLTEEQAAPLQAVGAIAEESDQFEPEDLTEKPVKGKK